MGWFGGPTIKIGATVRDLPIRVREDETPGVIIHRGIEVIAAKEPE